MIVVYCQYKARLIVRDFPALLLRTSSVTISLEKKKSSERLSMCAYTRVLLASSAVSRSRNRHICARSHSFCFHSALFVYGVYAQSVVCGVHSHCLLKALDRKMESGKLSPLTQIHVPSARISTDKQFGSVAEPVLLKGLLDDPVFCYNKTRITIRSILS